MKTTRRKFMQSTLTATAAGYMPMPAAASDHENDLQAYEIGKRHRIVRDVPGPNFFEGMLLGNGDVGVCAVVRPDALGLHIGKSDCWDIRVSEDIEKYVLTFEELLSLWAQASEAAKQQGKPDMLYLETSIDFFRNYTEKVSSSYRMPWPRPWPCGTVLIHWDPRCVHTGRQALDPSNGLFTLELSITEVNRQPRTAKVTGFVDWDSGLVSVSTDSPVPFTSVCYYPEIDRESVTSDGEEGRKFGFSTLPPPSIDGISETGFVEFSCYQHFPAIGPTRETPNPPKSDRDRNFSLYARLQGNWTIEDLAQSKEQLKGLESGTKSEAAHYDHRPRVFLAGRGNQIFRMDLKVATPRDLLIERLERAAAGARKPNPLIIINQDHAYSQEDLDTASYARKEVARLSGLPVEKLRQSSDERWREFWSRSAVELDDKELERIWYHNQYFLACCLRPQKTAPGLFGNWSTGRIGTAWHSDYHMDYNTQQVFWGVFSSNHAEQHLPYVELCQNLMPMSERYAREKFNLPGAYFPHSAYPAPSQVVPYPVPPWGYQISETPWTVQSLWWHYLYTQDVDYLKKVYPMLRAAARFMAAYVKKGGDGKYHVTPTVSSENWGFTVDYRLNKDCILDLALTAFLLDAAMEASSVLQTDGAERIGWKEIHDNLAPYPKASGPYGEVWLDVENAPVEYIYNVPITMAPVFPTEQVGIGRSEEQLDIARRTAMLLRLEGGNDLVYQPLIRARLGMLDLKWFKNQVRYCLLPNGAANDRVRQVGGRYRDSTNFDFMMRMGIWTENLSLPAVINECLMQSYTGMIRLFPNTKNLGPARFRNLRAAGAFLVSAAFDGKSVLQISIHSEKGKAARVANPWKGATVRVTRERDSKNIPVRAENGVLTFPTDAGKTYRVTRV